MLLQYKTADRFLLAALSSLLLHIHPEISFSWIPFLSMLCVACPDRQTHDSIEEAIRSELNVEPFNPAAV